MSTINVEDYDRLFEALSRANINDIAHAIIYFEKKHPSIHENVKRISDLIVARVKTFGGPHERVEDLLWIAMQRRRERVGEHEWLSKY